MIEPIAQQRCFLQVITMSYDLHKITQTSVKFLQGPRIRWEDVRILPRIQEFASFGLNVKLWIMRANSVLLNLIQ